MIPFEPVSLHIITVRIFNPIDGKNVLVNALLDSGASENSLDIQLAKELGLEGKSIAFKMAGSGGIVTNYGYGMVSDSIRTNPLKIKQSSA